MNSSQSSAYLISSIVNEIYLYNDPHPKSMLRTFIFNHQDARNGFEIIYIIYVMYNFYSIRVENLTMHAHAS